MSFLDSTTDFFDDVTTSVTCRQVVTAAQRTALLNEIGSYQLEIANLIAQYPTVNRVHLTSASRDLDVARNALANASRRTDGRYCLVVNVDELMDGAALEVTTFEAAQGGEEPWTDYGPPTPDNWGTGGSGSSGQEVDTEGSGPVKPGTDGSGTGNPALSAPPSSALTILGGVLLAGAAVVGVVALAKRKR